MMFLAGLFVGLVVGCVCTVWAFMFGAGGVKLPW